MEEKEIKDKELLEIENERYEARTKLEEARLEAIRTAEIVAKERERKRQQVLSSLQKFDQSTDPEAYLSSFELFMREGVIPEREWPAILRKQASGRIMEVMMDLDLTIPYHRSSRIYWNIWDTPKQKPGGRCGLQSLGTTSHHEVFWNP